MPHRRLLAVLGLAALCRLALPVDATAQTVTPRKRPTTSGMAIGDGTEAVDQPGAHMTQNLRKTRRAQQNLRSTPQARVQPAPRPRKATTRPAPRSVESLP